MIFYSYAESKFFFTRKVKKKQSLFLMKQSYQMERLPLYIYIYIYIYIIYIYIYYIYMKNILLQENNFARKYCYRILLISKTM